MNRLREVRVLSRTTQFQLRIATGIHQSKISMIENGLIQPREDEMKRLSKALGARLEEIFPMEQTQEAIKDSGIEKNPSQLTIYSIHK